MENTELHLQVITPRGIKFDRRAKMVIFRCIDGDMGILPGHEPSSVVMGDGILRIICHGAAPEERLAVFGGVATIENDTVKLLTNIAQLPEEIDLAGPSGTRSTLNASSRRRKISRATWKCAAPRCCCAAPWCVLRSVPMSRTTRINPKKDDRKSRLAPVLTCFY